MHLLLCLSHQQPKDKNMNQYFKEELERDNFFIQEIVFKILTFHTIDYTNK
jgi:hypothetical protein